MADNYYTHLFFDLDHTLWDFDKNSEITLCELFGAYRLSDEKINLTDFLAQYAVINKQYWHNYESGKITKEALRIGRFTALFALYGIDDEAFITEFGERYLDISPRQPHLYKNTYEALEYLKQKGYSMHIISNGLQEAQATKLEASKIAHFFDTMTLPEEAGATKPSKQIYDFALEKAGAKAEKSIYLGDDPFADIEGSIKAGWHQVFYNRKGLKHDLKPKHEITDWSEIYGIL